MRVILLLLFVFACHKGTDSLQILTSHVEKAPIAEATLIKAITNAGESKLKEAMPYLTKTLFDKNSDVAVASLVALTRIGDPKAVPDVIQFAQGKPLPLLRQSILAAREMGGQQAAAWLFTLSSGHPDEEVRQVATDALKKVEQRLSPKGDMI